MLFYNNLLSNITSSSLYLLDAACRFYLHKFNTKVIIPLVCWTQHTDCSSQIPDQMKPSMKYFWAHRTVLSTQTGMYIRSLQPILTWYSSQHVFSKTITTHANQKLWVTVKLCPVENLWHSSDQATLRTTAANLPLGYQSSKLHTCSENPMTIPGQWLYATHLAGHLDNH